MNGCQQIYYIVLSTKEESSGDNRKWMDNVKEDPTWRQGNFISNDLTIIQNRIEWRRLAAASTSFLKMIEKKVKIRVRHAVIMVYDLVGLSLLSDLERVCERVLLLFATVL